MEKIDLKAKKVSTHNMRKILPLYFKHKGLLFVTMIFIFSSGVFGILVPISSANMLASIADGKFELAIKFTLICPPYSHRTSILALKKCLPTLNL